MPANVTSRYRGVTPIEAPDASGTPRASLPARLPPSTQAAGTPYFHTVVAGETLELLAHRYLGSSQAWWQLADANPGVFPVDLRPGTSLVIPTQIDPTRVVRTRSF
jgi:nucleoid-associated protein YgaU